MIIIVKNSPRPRRMGFEGAVCVPIACLRKCSTSVMRRNGVKDIRTAGRTVKPVNMSTICIGRPTDVALPLVWEVAVALSVLIPESGLATGVACRRLAWVAKQKNKSITPARKERNQLIVHLLRSGR